MQSSKNIVSSLTALLKGGHAHASFEDAVQNVPFASLGERPQQLPYSIWQLTEHIRIAQWDMLEFSKDPSHQSPKWPDEYWPKETAPANEEAWKKCIEAIKHDRKQFIQLLDEKAEDLFKAFEHGSGQTLFQEALQIADHTAYHVGEIIIIRRLLGNWKS